ncbi:hypothetical protein HD806DRAFT_493543 [Xylariaceae sp. AK1471]|nr:hypothetical protein HD806DRAFT_493543 [Xylariaceae sp. AK1471]
MATSREERMQQRMRGAGRHEVADDSFGFVLPDAEASSDPPSSVPQLRSEPNTSAKRRRLDNEPGSANSQPSSPSIVTRSSTRLNSEQKPTQNNALPQYVVGSTHSPQLNSTPTARRISARLNTLNINQDDTPKEVTDDDTTPRGLSAAEPAVEEPHDEADFEAPLAAIPQRASLGSAAPILSSDSMMALVEEVMESPVAAPGSGRRRRIGQTNATTQSAKLQRVVMEEEAGATGEVAISSPLARKTRQSTTTLGTVSARTTRTSARRVSSSPTQALYGSSPLARHSHKSDSIAATGSTRSTRSQNRRSTLSSVVLDADELSSPPDAMGTSSTRKPRPRLKEPKIIPESPHEIVEIVVEDQQAEANDMEAEDVDNNKSAHRIGRKRARVGRPRQKQPPDEEEVEEVEENVEIEEPEEAEEVDDHEAARRIGRKRRRASPQQKQPPNDAHSLTPELEPPAKKSQSRRKRVSPAKQAQPKAVKEKRKPFARRKSDGDSIPIAIQRYTKPLRRNDGDTDEDILNVDMPFADHKSPNVIDVVLQMCEESLDKYLSVLYEEASQAGGSANRKEYRTKLRTVEAFQEELRTRLQAQTIALDNLRTLKKRVRAAQKDKVSLRNEILRIRAEREQVALKIDAVRIRHETANKETLHQLGLSSTMDDIELAIENGKTGPQLNAKEQKVAELANLDLLISQVANQVGAAGERGGALKQIKEFNAFLERAAVALEGR